MTISCLIVEDQFPAQRVLALYIADLPHLELVGTCGTAFEAMAVLHERTVDLMFLDLNLPRLGGFDLLRSISSPPKVIVTTAYPEHALEGFELAVSDYLVKPVAFDRFIRAVNRVRATMVTRDVVTGSTAEQNAPARNSDHVFVKVDGELRRLAVSEIVFLRGEGDYVSIVTTDARLFVAGTLGGWEARLPSDRFVRTHKSYIVNLAHVNRVRGATIDMPGGGIPIGRSFRDRLMLRLS